MRTQLHTALEYQGGRDRPQFGTPGLDLVHSTLKYMFPHTILYLRLVVLRAGNQNLTLMDRYGHWGLGQSQNSWTTAWSKIEIKAGVSWEER